MANSNQRRLAMSGSTFLLISEAEAKNITTLWNDDWRSSEPSKTKRNIESFHMHSTGQVLPKFEQLLSEDKEIVDQPESNDLLKLSKDT